MKIIETGIYSFLDNQPMFKVMVLNTNENLSDDHSEISENDIDFVIKEMEGSIKFFHYTDELSLKSILDNGFVIEDKDTVPDLGIGVYCVLDTTDVGIYAGFDNIFNYFRDCGAYEVSEIECLYDGKYYLCIYGEEHEVYIVIPEENIDKIVINDYKEKFTIYNI